MKNKLKILKDMNTELKMVIDADNNKCLERFEESKAEEIKAKYESMGKWGEVSLDINNDLILWDE